MTLDPNSTGTRPLGDRVTARGGPRVDGGLSLIEVLVAIVLLGTTVVATLTALQVTIVGSRLERDHAKAYQWLQSANGVLQATPRVSCDEVTGDPADFSPGGVFDGERKMRLTYQQAVRIEVVNPEGWVDNQLTVVYPVRVWDGEQYWEPALAPQPCYDQDGFYLQLVTMQVTNPAGEIIESIQVVKGA